MYSLTQTPIFLEFLYRVIGSINGKEYPKIKLEDQFFIIDRCKCNQRDCASVILKSKKPLVDVGAKETFNMRRGYVFLNILSRNELEIECINYMDFPHKDEIRKLVKTKGEATKVHVKSGQKKKKLSYEHKKKIDSFFKKTTSVYEKELKEGMDKSAFSGVKLFCHVR